MKSRPKIEEWIGVACMVVLTIITLGNVLTRYFSDESFAWTEEISVFLIVVMTLAGASGVAGRDGHIRIEYFYDRGSAARQRVLRLLAAASTALVFVALAVLFGATLAGEIRWNETSMGLGVPRWWFTIAIPPLCLAIALRAAWAGRQAWREPPSVIRGDTPAVILSEAKDLDGADEIPRFAQDDRVGGGDDRVGGGNEKLR